MALAFWNLSRLESEWPDTPIFTFFFNLDGRNGIVPGLLLGRLEGCLSV
jgi:hypothetical protein